MKPGRPIRPWKKDKALTIQTDGFSDSVTDKPIDPTDLSWRHVGIKRMLFRQGKPLIKVDTLIDEVASYFDNCLKNDWAFSVPGLATHLGIATKTLNHYARGISTSEVRKEEKMFIMEVLSKAKQIIEDQYINDGLKNKVNAVMTIFLLKSNLHSYVDEPENKTIEIEPTDYLEVEGELVNEQVNEQKQILTENKNESITTGENEKDNCTILESGI